MSFGYSVGDFLALTQLAWKVVQSSRKACGAHDDLTREVTSLHLVLHRLQLEVSKPESLINRKDDNRRKELAVLSRDCNRVLRVLSQILEKYNALSDEERSFTKLWQRIRFGNGEMQDLTEIRQKISTYTSAITLFLNLLLIGSQGRVERYMDSQGGELKGMRDSLNWITASLQAKTREGSVLTSYAEDDKTFWKDFRRELIKEGFSSAVLSRHKAVIKEYVMELGSRGALDDLQHNDEEAFIQAESSMSPSLSLSALDQPTAVKKRTPMVTTIEEVEDEDCKATITPEGQEYHASHAEMKGLEAEEIWMMAEKQRLKEMVWVGQSREEQECSEPTYSGKGKLKEQQSEAMKNEHNTREEDIAPEAEVVLFHNDIARDSPQVPEPEPLVNVMSKEEVVVADKIEAFSFWGATKKTKLKEKKRVEGENDDWSGWGSTKKPEDKEGKAVQDESEAFSFWGASKKPKGKEEKAVQDENDDWNGWGRTKKLKGKDSEMGVISSNSHKKKKGRTLKEQAMHERRKEERRKAKEAKEAEAAAEEKKVLRNEVKAFSFWGATKIPKLKEKEVVVDEVDDWSNWGTTKKPKDEEKKVVVDEIDDWSNWGTTKKLKDKEEKAIQDETDDWSGWGSTKNPKVKEEKAVQDEDDAWSGWGSAKKPKGKEENAVQDETDLWGVWGKTKNRKGREGNAVQDESEAFSFWGATKKSAGKPPLRQ